MRFDFWHKWKLEDGQLFFALVGVFIVGVAATISYTILSDLETCRAVAEVVPEIKLKDLK